MKKYLTVLFILFSGCAFFNELMNPSDIAAPLTHPSVEILSPTNGEIVEYYYEFTVKAKGVAADIEKVIALLDGTDLGGMKFDGSNWTISVTIDDSNSTHTFSAYATDKKGNVSATNSVTVNHLNVLLETIPLEEGEILIAFDFSGTYKPEEWGVIPFIYGNNISEYLDGAGDNENFIQGISQFGSGEQVLKYDAISKIYYIIITVPDDSFRYLSYRVDNYSAAGWEEVINGIHGVQLLTTCFENLEISNKIILDNNLDLGGFHINSDAGTKKDGITLSICRRRVMIDVGEHFGWSLHLVGGTTATIDLKMVWTNVPHYIFANERRESNSTVYWDYSVWDIVAQTFSNTITHEVKSNAYPVITGDRCILSTNNNTNWAPEYGLPLSLILGPGSNNNVLTLDLTLPPGAFRSMRYKVADTLGWNYGCQTADYFIGLPTEYSGTFVKTNCW